jgi:hypothetical protein
MSRFFTGYLGRSTSRLTTAPRIELSGDVVGAGTLPYVEATLKASGVVPGTYSRVEVNDKGQVIRGLAELDQGQAGSFAIRRYLFPEASLVWTIQHDMGTDSFTVTLLNSSGERIYANEKVIDSNSFEIEFTEPESGSASVVFNLM